MSELGFVNHHQHTMFSINDCIVRIEDLVKKAVEVGNKSVTITDHGTLGGCYNLWKECKKANLKPILGVEGYYVDDYAAPESQVAYNYAHIILIAKNYEGWQNLKLIQSKAWEVGHNKKPRIDFATLKIHRAGLICTTACMGGLVGWNYIARQDAYFGEEELKVRKKILKKRLNRFLDLFGDDLWLEMHYNEIDEQIRLNKYIVKLSKIYGTKLIAANDCHYMDKFDWKYHDIMICNARKQLIAQTDNSVYSQFTKQLYFKDAQGMESAYQKWHSEVVDRKSFEDSMNNTLLIRDKVEQFPLKPATVCLPGFSDKPKETMYKEVMIGWSKKLTKKQQESKEYKDRLQYEIDVFEKLKMENYMLVCADIVKRAKAENIPCGPGRGSVCGSLVAFCMDISQVDPIRFNTNFDRFLIASRLSLPDIDMDFGREGRNRIKEIVKELYGEDKFASIVTYGDWKPRGLIKDIGKVLGRKFEEMNAVTTKIHDKTKKFADEEFPMNPEVIDWLDKNKEIFKPALKLEGIYRGRGVHASGMLLTPTKLEDWVPVSYMIEKDSEDKKPIKVSEWDMYAVEDLNILKIDFLGLVSLDVIKTTCELSKKIKLDNLWQMCLDDLENPKVFEMMAGGHLTGIFQMETSEGMHELVKQMNPHCFYDIVMAISLYRTAIIQAGMLDEYIKRRNGEEFEYIHPSLEPILKKTFGILVFQEDLMEIAVKIGGFTPQESDNFRKATKLKDPEKFKPWKDQLVNGAMKNGWSEEEAEKLWDWMYQFSGYGFNLCHAVAYGLITYATAWLKVHYPAEFMTAIMTWNAGDAEMMPRYLQETKRLNLTMFNPNINTSTEQFRLRKKGILYPFTCIKGVGEKCIEEILTERKNGEFESFDNFYERINKRVVNVNVMVNLILSGAFKKVEGTTKEETFDKFIGMRDDKTHRQVYCSICKSRFPCVVKPKEEYYCPSCGGSEITFDAEECAGKKFNETFLYHKVYGFSSGGSSLKQYVNLISKYKAEPLSEIEDISDGQAITVACQVKNIKKWKDKNGGTMAFIDVTDGEFDCSLTMFASDWEELQKEVTQDCCYIIKAFKNRGNNLLYSTRGKIKSKLIRLGI